MDTNLNQEAFYAKYKPLSPWAYLGYILLFCIPGINIIAILILAFAGENVNRKNLARAYIINMCISLVISVILAGVIVGLGGFIFNQAKDVTDDAISSIDSIMVQTINNQFIIYEGDSVRGSRVKSLLDSVESCNEEDLTPQDIVIKGETDIDPTATYEVSLDYDSKTGYVSTITISEVE